jgi:hypothetical protein
LGGETIAFGGSLKRSSVAQVLAGWASFSYWFALVIAVLSLLAAGAFAVLEPEPPAQRLISFVVLGFVPATAAYAIGWLTFLTLRGAGAIYDFIIAGGWLALRILTKTVVIACRFLVRLSTKLLRQGARKVTGFMRACRQSVERGSKATAFYVILCGARVLIAILPLFGRFKQLKLQAASMFPRWMRECRRWAWTCVHRLFTATRRYSRQAGRACIISATFPVRLIARILIRLEARAMAGN